MSHFTRQTLHFFTGYPSISAAAPNVTAFPYPSFDEHEIHSFRQDSVLDLQWHWYYALYLSLCCQLVTIWWRYWWKAPVDFPFMYLNEQNIDIAKSNIPIVAYPTPLGRWLMAWHMMIDAETILLNAYKKYERKPFAIPTTERWIIFVSERDDVAKLKKESELVLSSEQALHEIALTDYILGSHQTPPEHKGPKSENNRIVSGVLKNKLRSRIPDLSMGLKDGVRDAVIREVPFLHDENQPDFNEWQRVRLMPALLRIFTRVNLLAFFGEKEGTDPSTYLYTISFFWTCACAFTVIKLIPSWIVPVLGPVSMCFGFTRNQVFKFLRRIAVQFQDKDESDIKSQKQNNIVRWLTEMTKIEDAAAIAKIALGLIFASAFQIPMIAQSCLHKLCKHSEYQEKLIEEAEEYKDKPFSSKNQEMPYLDSLLRETGRLCPGPIVTSPRTVMKSYTSPDYGYHVPSGNWLAIPQVAVMQDETLWPNAKTFEPFRHVNEDGTSKTRFTHPSHEYPFWGSTQDACPSRFYVSVLMKMVLAHILSEYEIKLENPKLNSSFISFGVVRVPSPFVVLLMRKRVPRETVE